MMFKQKYRMANDFDSVPVVSNTEGTVKAIIIYLKNNPKRRKLVPKIPLLCDTVRNGKYKSMRLFDENLKGIIKRSDRGRNGLKTTEWVQLELESRFGSSQLFSERKLIKTNAQIQ